MYKQKQGFTLVELIVVSTILAILGTIAIMAFGGYSKNARDSVRVTDISNIMKGVELYSLKAGNYPEPDEAVVYTGGTSSSIKQGKIGDLVSSNISISGDLTDPLTQEKYVYSVFGNSKYYQIGAEKENDQTLLIDSAYAESGKVIVKGNYFFDPSLPSLIIVPSSVTGSGIFDPNVCFVVDGGVNTFDSCIETKSEMALKSQDSSLIGYWDMESLTLDGKLKDISGNSNYGVLTGGLIYANSLTGGIMGKGLSLSGSFIEVINNLGLDIDGDITISSVISLKDPSPASSIFSRTGNYNFHILDNNLRLGDNNGNGLEYLQYTIGNNFHNFVGKWGKEENKISIYLDGIKLISGPPDNSGAILKTSNVSGVNYIGNNPAVNQFFNGIIDDIKIYNRALSDEEILQQAKIAGF